MAIRKGAQDFVQELLTEFSPQFSLTLDTCFAPYANQSYLVPTYTIKERGLFDSTNRILGSRRVVQLFDRDTVAGTYPLPKEPRSLTHYVIFRRELITETAKRMLQDSTLLEWDPSSEKFRLPKLEYLDDVNLSEIKDGPDKRIENLVRALRGVGIATGDSCEGHLDRGNLRYPFVDFWKHDQEVRKMVEPYNKTSPVKWEIWRLLSSTSKLYVLKTAKTATNETELRELQQSVEDLAQFIFHNYISMDR